MRDTKPLDPIAILALNMESEKIEHRFLERQFPGRWKQFQGVYKGQAERSYLVPLKNYTRDLNSVLFMAKETNQESILLADPDRNCELVYVDSGNRESIGQLKHVPKAVAVQHDAYTYDQEKDKYYICV